MHILFLNWKDTSHPFAGGAEYVTERFAQELVKRGHTVTLVCAHAPGLKKFEKRRGMSIYRGGNTITVRLFACWIYITQLKSSTDIVIDQIHGLPFFTPVYVQKPIIAWIHEIAGPIWDYDFPKPFALLGKWAEKMYFFFYKNIPFITDTVSTRDELTHYGVAKKQITVIPLTIDPPPKKIVNKSKYPSISYIGRLSPMKRIEMLISASKYLVMKFANLKIYIAGKGKKEYIKSLQERIIENDLEGFIEIQESISNKEKWLLLGSSWLHIHPSLKEGYGLTVLEAASQATPTIAFAVNGLIDTIQNGKNGFCIPQQSVSELANKIKNLLDNTSRLKKLQKSSFQWYKKLPTWSDQTDIFEEFLKRAESF